jgi:hypothetical protein
MSLFKKNKPTMIPLLQEPEDKKFDDIKLFKEKDDEGEDADFPMPQPEDIYLKIDEMNELAPINKNYLLNIYEKIGTYREGEPTRFEVLLKNVKEIFERICGSYSNLFDFSYKMSKKLEVTKEQIEQCYEELLKKKNATTLDLDSYTLSVLGRMISYSYTKLDQFKIKDMNKLEESISKIREKKINIYDEFVKWCIKEKKDPKKEKITEYYKKRRKDYDCLPEVIFLVNHFSSITTVNLELDKIYNQEFSEEEYKYFEIGVLNIHWILMF